MLFRNRLSRAWPWLSGVGTRWQNRQTRRRRKLSERSWGLEALEVRTLMSASWRLRLIKRLPIECIG